MFSKASRRVHALNTFTPTRKVFQAPRRPFFNNTRPSQRPRPTTISLPHVKTHIRSLTFSDRFRRGLREAKKDIWRKNPILFPLAIISAIGASAVLIYIIYVQTTQVNPQYHKFPPSVAKLLRVAIYHTEIDPNPQKALTYYKEALRRAGLEGMHEYSDEVLGIKLQIVAMLEQAKLYKAAIGVLKGIRKNAFEWVEKSRKAKKAADILAPMKSTDLKIDDPNVQELENGERKLLDWAEQRWSNILKKIIGMDLELAQLYLKDDESNMKEAEAARVSAVELCLKEMKRRQGAGLPVVARPEDPDNWLTLEEVGSVMTALAETYFAQAKMELALPLFMQALSMIRQSEDDEPTCKQVVLLQNIATSMWEDGNSKRVANQETVSDKKRNSKLTDMEAAAVEWFKKTLEVAARVQPPVRDWECDLSCASATLVLGVVAKRQGNLEKAKKLFSESKRLAAESQFEEAVQRADMALADLDKKEGQ